MDVTCSHVKRLLPLDKQAIPRLFFGTTTLVCATSMLIQNLGSGSILAFDNSSSAMHLGQAKGAAPVPLVWFGRPATPFGYKRCRRNRQEPHESADLVRHSNAARLKFSH